MSQTLGEKLRQAREEGGLTLADVAEQTHISSLYLEAIEHDDYKILPGGIFNKGFIKSYAKFVGIDEQEALMDYQSQLARTEGAAPPESEQRTYRPEVLTDDHSGSMLPTIIVAALVLALMTGGILYLVSYLRGGSSTVASNTAKPAANAAVDPTPAPTSAISDVPSMSTIKVEFKATDAVSVMAVVDGKATTSLVAAGSSTTFEPKESLKLSYSRSLANSVQLAINGKPITPPASPTNPRRAVIEFEINKDDLPQIWSTGSIVAPSPVDTAVNANVAAPAPIAKVTPRPAPAATANTAANVAKPSPANTAKPPTMTGKPPAMMTTTKPTPKPGE